ncbi:peptidase M23 [Micromonospora sp. NPDC023956]|uniref:peptidase M23 n=1 Tax=Micromonospora sp. NPDC023956 TaxID=3155722 RepID=UPI0033E249FC
MRDDDKIHYRPAPTSADDRKVDGSSAEQVSIGQERSGLRRKLSRALARRPGSVSPGRATVALASAAACCLGLVAVVELRTTSGGSTADTAGASAELLRRTEQEHASRGLVRTPSAPPSTPSATPSPSASTTPAPTASPTPRKTTPTKKPTPRRPVDPAPVAGLTVAQMNNAKKIVRTGRAMGVPRRALVIAVATAMQESNLYNLASGALPESQNHANQGLGWDHDSVGLFQQRASMGWGTVAELMDPAYATRAFLTTLLAVPGWQQMRLTEAAQAVQVSAYPEAYAPHEPRATVIVNAIVAPAT